MSYSQIETAAVPVAASQSRPSLGLWKQVVYGAGEIPNAIKTIGFGLFTLYFYTSVIGLPGTLVGIASAVGVLWDAIIDPYIGWASDRATYRFGRRHTFMLAGALTMGVTFWAFFHPPAGLSTTGLFAWLMVTSLLVRTATSLYGVPYFAFGAELSSDYQERTSITAVRGALALLGTMAAASLSFVVFFPDTIPGVDPKLNRAGYSEMGLVLGAAMTVLSLVVTLQTRGWRHLATTVVSNSPATEPPGTFFASFVRSFANRSFRLLFASYSLVFLALVINSTLSIHYLTHYVRIETSVSLGGLQAAFYVGALLGVGFWLWASRRLEKHLVYFLALLCIAAVMLASLYLVGDGHALGVGNVRALTIGHAMGGFFGSVLWFVPGSMIADVADEDALTTAQRREGSFFGLFYFGQQIAASISLLVTGTLIERYAGLQAGQSEPSASTIHRIGVLYGGLPAVLVLVAACLILGYSLTRSRVRAIQRGHLEQAEPVESRSVEGVGHAG